MKKSILSLALLAFAGVAAIAQDFKPTSGSKTLELQAASPFASGRPFSIDNIRARYFIADDMAVRVQFGIFVNNETKQDTAAGKVLKDRERLFNLNIKPGIEKHFEGTDRLSPYVGAELDIAIQSASSVDERITGPNDAIGTVTVTGRNNRGDNGYFRFGVNLVGGADYYISKNLYLGAEVGWGIQSVSLSTIKTELSGFEGATAPKDFERGGTLNVGTNFIGAFRFGWAF